MHEDLQPGPHGFMVEYRHNVRVELMFEHYFSRLAIYNLAAIERQDEPTMPLQFQFFGHRHDAIRGPTRCQYNPHAALLRLHQSFLGLWRNLFLAVGQRAIEVKCD